MDQSACCADCRDFLQNCHGSKFSRLVQDPYYVRSGRFHDSIDYRRSIAKITTTANTGCFICTMIIRKFGSIQPYLLSVAQLHSESAIFRVVICPNHNTNCQWDEDIDRPFLQVCILQQVIEFRLWRVVASHTPDKLLHDGHSTKSEKSFARAKEWLRRCTIEHAKCNKDNVTNNWAPTRLLDVGAGSPYPDTIRLRETRVWNRPAKYAALSHSWGAVQPFKLLQGNLQALMKSISVDDLPQTFQDAVFAIRKLGIQYLWIDSLCIIQNSTDDWMREASLMQHVYGRCFLNIAAAASSDCTGGLFKCRSSYVGPRSILLENEGETTLSQYQLWDQSLWDIEFEAAKLNTRAWVLQERVLSSRTLAFSREQLFWECRCKRACEEFPLEYPTELFEKWERDFEQPDLRDKLKVSLLSRHADSRSEDQVDRLNLAWHNLVMLYSGLDMTFEKDKLIAISGLSALFSKQLKQNYLAGLWGSTLMVDLLWEAVICTDLDHRPESYRAPSWSWASVGCPVRYNPGRIDIKHATVVNVKVQTSTSDSDRGKLASGNLRLNGKLFGDISVTRGPNQDYFLRKNAAKDISLNVTCFPDDILKGTKSEEELLCLSLGSFWDYSRAIGYKYEHKGLVLSPAKRHPQGYYKRWGVFESRGSSFFKTRSNQAPSYCYIAGEEDTMVII